MCMKNPISVSLSLSLCLSLSLSLQGLEKAAVQLLPPRANAHPQFKGFVCTPKQVCCMGLGCTQDSPRLSAMRLNKSKQTKARTKIESLLPFGYTKCSPKQWHETRDMRQAKRTHHANKKLACGSVQRFPGKSVLPPPFLARSTYSHCWIGTNFGPRIAS